MKSNDELRPPLSRRDFIKNLAVSGVLLQTESTRPPRATSRPRPRTGSIDRQDLISRHSPVIRRLDPLAPLSVGNGEFAFTADVTGLQTFPEKYERAMPLCTMSQWGWHTAPQSDELRTQKLRLTMFEAHGRKVGYSVESEGQNELYKWLRENPHRLHLGRIGLMLMKRDGGQARAGDLTDIEQRLDLWTGVLTSRFRIHGRLVSVITAVHPAIDLLAVKIESELISQGLLGVRFAFPYGSPAMQAADWSGPDRHKSELSETSRNRAVIHRRLDDDAYRVAIEWEDGASIASQGEHQFVLTPDRRRTTLKFLTSFSASALSAMPSSMLAAFGALPGVGVDKAAMRETLKLVLGSWQWGRTWGWDYPLTAITAARLGEPKLAIDALMMETEKNRYLPNGHNWQRNDLPCYLPWNGGLLYAVG